MFFTLIYPWLKTKDDRRLPWTLFFPSFLQHFYILFHLPWHVSCTTRPTYIFVKLTPSRSPLNWGFLYFYTYDITLLFEHLRKGRTHLIKSLFIYVHSTCSCSIFLHFNYKLKGISFMCKMSFEIFIKSLRFNWADVSDV